MKRIADEPAYVLHRYDWSESSLIVDLFTRDAGRVAVAAKGAKRPTSNLRAVLLPYCIAGPGLQLHFPMRSQQQPKLRAFIDCARQVLRAH